MSRKFYFALTAGLAAALWFYGSQDPDSSFDVPVKTGALRQQTADSGRKPVNRGAVGVSRIVSPGEPRSVAMQLLALARADSGVGVEEIERLLALMSVGERIELLAELLRSEAADEWDELRAVLVRHWARENPTAAATWLASWPDSLMTREAKSQVALVWASIDLPGAWAWVQSWPAGEAKTTAQVNLGYEAARSDSMVALAIATELPASIGRDQLLLHAVQQWAAIAPVEALDWSEGIQDHSLRQRVLAEVTVAWAEHDPVAAATAALKSLPAGESQDRCIISIMQRWAQQSPQAAADWVAKFPAIPLRDVALQNLIMLWVHDDPALPAGWIKTLPAGELRDCAVASYAAAVGPRDPGTTAQWIETIADERRRTHSLQALNRLRFGRQH